MIDCTTCKHNTIDETERCYRCANDFENGYEPVITDEDKIITGLPKGHGRLIDADALCDYFWDNRSKLYTHKDLQIIIDRQPTIIEAGEGVPISKFLEELKRKILMEVDGGTGDMYLRYTDICNRISNSIDEYKAECEELKGENNG